MASQPQPKPDLPAQTPPATGWLRVGVLAAASVLAGGLAVAWYYRNTLTRPRQAEALEQDRLDGNEGESS